MIEVPEIAHSVVSVPELSLVAQVIAARIWVPQAVREPRPLVLAVQRTSAPNCGSKIVFPALGVSRDLPIGSTTLIELPPFQGSLAFTCGMGMYRGVVVALAVSE